MIKMLHFADVHIGMENYGRTEPLTGLSTRVVDFLKRVDEMIDYSQQHAVDVAIFAGDAFKNSQPNPTFQREFAHRVRDLSQICPVVLLVGNHDLPSTKARAYSIEIYETLSVPNVWVADSYDLKSVETHSGPLQIATAPYPTRARLFNGEESHGLSIAQVDAHLQQTVQIALADLAQRAAKSSAPRVLTGHFTVSGATFGSERNVMVGRDVSVMLSEIADPVWDYVALGHIHKHQNLTDGRKGVPPVVYSGSLERIDFGEEGDSKGFCWVELERGNTSWQFVPVKARPFVTLRIDVRQSEDPMAKVLDTINRRSLEEAIVRLIIQAEPEQESKLGDAAIQNALREARVSMVASIQKDIERPVRSRLGDSPEGLTPMELLERYLISKAVDDEWIPILLERAEPFFNTNL
ncbi:MAG: exonuclease SbcCD subunit D [Chloroflexota bacterium]